MLSPIEDQAKCMGQLCYPCDGLTCRYLSCGQLVSGTVKLGGSHLEAQSYLLTPVDHARTLGDLQVEKNR